MIDGIKKIFLVIFDLVIPFKHFLLNTAFILQMFLVKMIKNLKEFN